MSIRLPGRPRRAITSGWRGTIGAGLAAAALCTVPVHPSAQTARQPQRPGTAAPLPPLPVTQLDDRLSTNARSGQTFSLSFSQPQPIRDVLMLMLKDTGLSVVIDPDVSGTFTGELANVTLKQALEITLPPLGLQYSLSDNVLRVSKRPTETRFFSVDRVATRRSSDRATTISPGSGNSRDSVTSSDAADFYDEAARTIGSMLSGDGSVTVDRKAGLVRVTDYPDRLERVSHYLELAELRLTRQVQIQATFVEVSLRDPASPGIDWGTVLKAAGDAVTATRQGSGADGRPARGLRIHNLDALLRAFATQGIANVVASPRIAVMNNEPAIVGTGTRRESRSVDGVLLTVTPQISADGLIQMNVSPALARFATVRGADTLVRVREGETVVIDGLMQSSPRHEHAKRRGLAGVPILGGLFGRHGKPAPSKTELVILITPTIVARSS